MSEIKQVMDFLGRGIQDGEVRGSHLGQILMYLKRTKKENMKTTLSKLALVCGTSQRNLRENYIEGLGCFGIIDIRTEGHSIMWSWVGASAFNGKAVMTDIRPPPIKETFTERRLLLDYKLRKGEISKADYNKEIKKLKKEFKK